MKTLKEAEERPTVFRASDDVLQTVDAVLWSMRLAEIRRFLNQRFWEMESAQSAAAELAEDRPRLETVAAHSWHVADTVLVIGPAFADVNISRATLLAVLHDKMEILTGDISPLDEAGTGNSTHAFNAEARDKKQELERRAVAKYVEMLPHPASEVHSSLLAEIIDGHSNEARFVKAIDKFQALAYVFVKKSGHFDDDHLEFTARYTDKAIEYWPKITPYLDELQMRLFKSVAEVRECGVQSILKISRSRMCPDLKA